MDYILYYVTNQVFWIFKDHLKEEATFDPWGISRSFFNRQNEIMETKIKEVLKDYPEAEDALLELFPQYENMIRVKVGDVFESEVGHVFQLFHAVGGKFQLMNMVTFLPAIKGDMREIRILMDGMGLTKKRNNIMGQSTDGQISYGIMFEEGHDFPWEMYEEEDWMEVNGQTNYTYSEQRDYLKKNPLPFESVNVCSGDCPIFLRLVLGEICMMIISPH